MLSILVGALLSPWLAVAYSHFVAKRHGFQWPVRGQRATFMMPLQAGVPGFFRSWGANLISFSVLNLTIYLMRNLPGSAWLIARPPAYFYFVIPIWGSLVAALTISTTVTRHLNEHIE